jgi:predicted XRE-type DNA-binding protein
LIGPLDRASAIQGSEVMLSASPTPRLQHSVESDEIDGWTKSGERRFGIKEVALVEALKTWCDQEYGRQAEAARAMGTTRQTVSDWFSGRKQMNGEQASRL